MVDHLFALADALRCDRGGGCSSDDFVAHIDGGLDAGGVAGTGRSIDIP